MSRTAPGSSLQDASDKTFEAPVTIAGVSRDRIAIDLAGLGPALRAHSQYRQLTVAATARSVLASALQSLVCPLADGLDPDLDLDANHAEKLTLRLRRGAANRRATLDRSAGLSYGAYLTTVLDGMLGP